MRRSRSLPLIALAMTTAVGGCAGPPPTPAGHLHTHTATVTVTDTALLPDPAVSIPTFATIVWRNQATAPLVIEVTAATCHQCDTVMGFANVATGARSVTVAPGGIATLCFHDAGTFGYEARVGAATHDGVIQVGAKP